MSSQQSPAARSPAAKLELAVEWLVFSSRWLLVPLLLGLALALVLYIVKFYQEFMHIVTKLGSSDEAEMVLGVLSLVDLVMVATLIIMVIISGYENFVSRLDVEMSGDKPSWLGKLDAGSLKIKLAASIVAISSIHLLRAFLNVAQIPNDKLLWLVVIHMTFVVSALMLAILDKIAFGAHR